MRPLRPFLALGKFSTPEHENVLPALPGLIAMVAIHVEEGMHPKPFRSSFLVVPADSCRQGSLLYDACCREREFGYDPVLERHLVAAGLRSMGMIRFWDVILAAGREEYGYDFVLERHSWLQERRVWA